MIDIPLNSPRVESTPVPGALPNTTFGRNTNVTLEDVTSEVDPTLTQIPRASGSAANSRIMSSEPHTSVHPLTGTVVRSIAVTPIASPQPIRPIPILGPTQPRRIQILPDHIRIQGVEGQETNTDQQRLQDTALRVIRDEIANQMRTHLATISAINTTIHRIDNRTITIDNNVDDIQGDTTDIATNARLGAQNSYDTYQAINRVHDMVQTMSQGQEALATSLGVIDTKQNTLLRQLDTLTEMIQGLDAHVSHAAESPQIEQVAPETERSWVGNHEYLRTPELGEQLQSTQRMPYARPHRPQTPAAVPIAELPKGAKYKKPEAYEGKRGAEAETFLMRMELYFQDYSTAFDDQRKIEHTLHNMTKGAEQWARALLRKAMAGESHEHLASWAHFKVAFNRAFGDPLKHEHAVQKIKSLAQKGSANNYTTEFRNLMHDLEWDDPKALIDTYKQGLKPSVQRNLLMMTIGRNTRLITLEEWMDLAIKTDEIEYATRNLSNNQASGSRNQRTEQGKAAYTPNNDTKKDNWVSAEVITKRKQENRCIKCGRTGHRIANCKAKTYMQDPVQGKAGKIEEVTEETEDKESTESGSEN